MVTFLAFVLMACGGDDDATVAGAIGSSESDSATTTLADAADASDGGHGDDENEGHDEDSHDDHDEDEGHDDDHDHDDEEGSSSGLGSHEHGVAELSVAWSEGDVVVDLISPTYNIFGFEHEPSTAEERALVAESTEFLSQAGVIVFNQEAGCELVDEVATELEFEGGHAELGAFWLFSCEQPDEIRELDVAAIFTGFPNLQVIDAQWASDSGQSAAELSPSAPVLGLG